MTYQSAQLTRQNFSLTREFTARITRNLNAEDQLLQSMPDASPTKWHLAHTSWFFDTFILKVRDKNIQPDGCFEYLFNSYYNQVGPQYLRANRHLISRPTLAQVWDYRHAVEERMLSLWDEFNPQELELIELGIHHEQQHQELIITDIKHALSFNPQAPALVNPRPITSASVPELRWHDFPAGEYEIGCSEGFCFDNEKPRHKIYINGFRLASRPITNSEYLAFIADRGYQNSVHWLSEGWAWVNEHQAQAPLYWRQVDRHWMTYSLAGLLPINPCEPVCHLNYYEACAFAQWAGKRLPTEFEWELGAGFAEPQGRFLNSDILHPQPAPLSNHSGPLQMFGDVWEWTQSAYLPYPGFRVPAGAVGEYNGKFMVNQWVLRGGSCATPDGHIRASYRNFFPVNANWQFSGVRLADDLN